MKHFLKVNFGLVSCKIFEPPLVVSTIACLSRARREKNHFKEINNDEKGRSILFLGKMNLFCTSNVSQSIKNNIFSNQVLCV